ncbi:hypothetical protein K7T73_15510 [Bacillus badius]|uniref:hypothetical protein n=1 Tax=Bacillus badius TaxID=1455 RepID=UPI000596F8FF|nr:hypothetical protein [Bacillus badius]UAT29954.1 hypothetical protein K7T73_15510 [Bacillus badius]
MNRKIASRKLKNHCICCNKSFVKGDVYYHKRVVFQEFGEIIAYEYIVCARCKYENERQSERQKRFIESGKCHHPITDVIWTTMAGEDYVKEPSHTECCICGEHV